MKKGISVLICTFNGSTRLATTLNHLANQSVKSEVNWEVIVVDNASTDGTFEFVSHEWGKYCVPDVDFTIVREDMPGRNNALAKGIHLCKYEYLINCDDDNWLSEEYLQLTYDLLDRHSHIGAVGGQAIAATKSGLLPNWFDEYKAGYAVGQQGRESGDVTSRGFLFGAGMGTRTQLYIELYKNFPSILIGRQGTVLSSGEDSEYCQRLLLRDYTLYYESQLILKHYIPEERLSVAFRERLFLGFEEAHEILSEYYFLNKLRRKLRGNIMNKIRLLIISPIRFLLAPSAEKRAVQIKIIAYILKIKNSSNPVFDAIHWFEREK